MYLYPMCKALHAGAILTPSGQDAWVLFFIHDSPPLKSHFSSHPLGPGVFVVSKTYVFRTLQRYV